MIAAKSSCTTADAELSLKPRSRPWPSPRATIKLRFAFTWAACVWLVMWRGIPRYLNEHLWAEDGTIYLARALNDGWASLVAPYAGYFQILPQSVVLLLSQYSLSYLPESIFLISVFVHATSAAVFALPTYRWLVASDWLRALTSLALCLAPGLWETLGNMANVQWPLLLWGGLIACKSLDEKITWFDVFVVVLIGSCAGGACTLLLPFGTRAFIRAKRGLSRDWAGWAAVVALSAWATAVLILRALAGSVAEYDLSQLRAFSAFTFFGRYILQPILGERAIGAWAQDFWEVVPIASFFAIRIIGLLWRNTKSNPVFIAWLLSSLGIYILAFLSRPTMQQQLFALSGIDRFALPAGQCALILWTVCIAGGGEQRRTRYADLLCVAFLWVYATAAWYRFDVEPFPGIINTSWKEAAVALEEGRAKLQPTTVLCRPNWQIHYEPR